MQRSKRYCFVPFCLLAQGIRAQGIVKEFPAIVNPIVDLLCDENINIIQMPCPELYLEGYKRKPSQKSRYDNEKYRAICQKISANTVRMMKMLRNNGNKVLFILGIEYSPSCAISVLTAPQPQGKTSGQGVYIEELQKEMEKNDLSNIPFVGIQIYKMSASIAQIKGLIKGGNNR